MSRSLKGRNSADSLYHPAVPNAVLFDFGGVVTTSPFHAFAAYEAENGLPRDLIRTINSTNPDDNAWAKLERSEVDVEEFVVLFEAEAAALGHEVSGHAVLECLQGDLRPEMVEVVRRCSERMVTGCLTNNFTGIRYVRKESPRQSAMREVMAIFNDVIESRKVGLRKPDPRIYRLACERLGVQPEETVYLDDLGINLKPARAMGMTTIKVTEPAQAIVELEAAVGFPLA